MISKSDKQEIDLVSLAQKIKASFNLKSDVSLTFTVDGLKINFASSNDFLATMQKMQEHHLYLNKVIYAEHFCIVNLKFIADLQRIIETESLNKIVVHNNIQISPSISSFKMMKDQFANLELNQSENNVITKIKPTILNLPLDCIFPIIRYLDYERAFHLVLCLISGHIEYSEENKNKKEPELPTFKSAFFYKELFRETLELKEKPIIASRLCFFSERGCFAWGSNNYGQLGLGHNDNQNLPQLITAFRGKKIIAMAGGRFHSVFLMNNEVYSCGLNNCGQLGLGHNQAQNLPQRITALKDKKIIAIAVGDNHSLFLTDGNEVYACGGNSYGQLGLGHENSQRFPQRITAFEGKKITAIAVGDRYSIFLTDNNEIYTCGSNDFGKLGLGHNDNDNQIFPQFITALKDKKIITIAVGYNHFLFLTDSSEVYACGSNCFGQLGLGHNKDQNLPQLITAFKDKKIIAIAVGYHHSFFVTNNKEVYACGKNSFGQLGLGDENDHSLPKLITAIEGKKINAVAAGQDHSLFSTDNNEIYACGSYSFGNLGLGDNVNQNVPTKISFLIENLQSKEKQFDNKNHSSKLG